MIGTHLPILQVVVPLLSAPVCAILRQGIVGWAIATAVSWITLIIAALLLHTVLVSGPVSYEIGGWAVPWGIEYRLDVLNAFVLLLVSGIGSIGLTYARLSVEAEIPADKINLFYAAYLLCLTGLLGITITGDAFNVFVFLEISSLSSYALIAMGIDRRAITAAYRYLVMGTIGATFILIGIGLLYMMTGTLNMSDLAQRLPAIHDKNTVHAAFAFLTVGISLKVALFPLHLWLPNAYAYAPSIVTAFLAGTATKVALYVLLRFFFTVFGAHFSFNVMQLDFILLPLSLIAIFAATTVAIFQEDVKRMLAYSSIAQIGYMTLGVSLATVAGATASILHMFNHALMKGALFLALGCVMYRIGSVRIHDMAGLGRLMPWTMAAFVVGAFSLIGIPLTVGFVSKWFLVSAALERDWWPVALLVVLGSLLAIVYVWRVIEAAYFKTPQIQYGKVQEAPLSLLLPTWVLVLANLYFGFDTSVTIGSAQRAAAALMGAAP